MKGTSLTDAFKSYSEAPFAFIWSTFLYLFMNLVAVFAAFGLYFVFFFLGVAIGMGGVFTIPSYIGIFFAFVFYIYLVMGTKAARIKAYDNALQGNKVSVVLFFDFMKKTAMKMMIAQGIRFLLLAIFVLPAIALHIFLLSNVPYVYLLIGAYILGIGFLIHFVTAPSMVMLSVKVNRVRDALKATPKFLTKSGIRFMMVYLLHGVSTVLSVVPLVNLFSIFLLDPVIQSAMINMVSE